MQLDALAVLAERRRTGADVVRELTEQYEDDPHRSTIYHHLDQLVDHGLAEKRTTTSSDRAKLYHITDDGRHVIREYTAGLAVRVQTGELHRQ